MQYKIKL